MSALRKFRQFTPPGPVAAAFLRDKVSLVRALRGPVGGGKTVTLIYDHLINAAEMPICKDGQKHFRVAILGQTYGQLERNLYPTWKTWLPPDGTDADGNRWTEAEFKGGGGRYATHSIAWRVPYGGHLVPVRFEAIFAAIGEQSVEAFMRGFEPTAFWPFEMDLLPRQVLDIGIGRLGRWPRREMVHGDADYRSYIAGDLNSPDTDSWFYKLFEEEQQAGPVPRADGFAHYAQPSGLSPQAENLKNLPRGYYTRQAALYENNRNLLKRFVLNQYAPSTDGEPVYPEYSDDRHLSRDELRAVPRLPVFIGVDAGLRAPAAVILQPDKKGRYSVLGEVVPGRVGTKSFAQLVKREVAEVAPGCEIAGVYCDPAGFAGGNSEDDQLAWAESLAFELGLPVEPTWTNAIDTRLDAVRDELLATIDGTLPALVVSRRCKSLRKGFASHYRYARRRQASSETLAPKPEKGEWSHVHDALQYALLGIKGRYGTISGNRDRARTAAAGSGAVHTIRNETRLFG